MLRPSHPIATERLDLRPFESGDLDALAAINSDPAVVRHLYFGVRGHEELRPVLAEKMERVALAREGDSLNLAAVLRGTGALVGDVTLFWRSREHRQGEVGCIVDPVDELVYALLDEEWRAR